MKKSREIISGIFVIIILVTGAVVLYRAAKSRERAVFARSILSEGSRSGIPETIDGLREAIARYEKEIDQFVSTTARAGTYWRIMAVRLRERGLHREALAALERAIAYYPADPSLLYFTGLSAAEVARSSLDFSASGGGPGESAHFFDLAESAWLKAISMDDTYIRPLYTLGVLYVFELDRSADAIPLMERYLDQTNNNADGMAVLAHAYALTGRYGEALDLYDEILSITKDAAKRQAVEESRSRVMAVYYGN
jgi:tetratricopeptide (TPR) repeat protein